MPGSPDRQDAASLLSSIPLTAPGWYSDPYLLDRLRYWDGRAWTLNTSPRVADPGRPRRSVLLAVALAFLCGGLALPYALPLPWWARLLLAVALAFVLGWWILLFIPLTWPFALVLVPVLTAALNPRR